MNDLSLKEDTMTRDELTQLVTPVPGENAERFRNVRYYLSYHDRAEKMPWFMSWNWAAFWGTILWFFYRRMYFYGVLLTVFSIVFTLVLDRVFLSWGLTGGEALLWEQFLCWMFSIPLALYANALYFHHLRTSRWRKRTAWKGATNAGVLWTALALVSTFIIALILGIVLGTVQVYERVGELDPECLERLVEHESR